MANFTKNSKKFDDFAETHRTERVFCHKINNLILEENLPLEVEWCSSIKEGGAKYDNADAKLYYIDYETKQKRLISELELEVVRNERFIKNGLLGSGWALTHGILSRKMNKLQECKTSGILFYGATGNHFTFYTPKLFRDLDASKIFSIPYRTKDYERDGVTDVSYKADWETFDILLKEGYVIVDDMSKALKTLWESNDD